MKQQLPLIKLLRVMLLPSLLLLGFLIGISIRTIIRYWNVKDWHFYLALAGGSMLFLLLLGSIMAMVINWRQKRDNDESDGMA